MTKTVKTKNEILKNPDNYAAIYARISSKKDNNSIEAQISKGKMVLNNENLLLYAVYTDHVSGRTTAPPDRNGFGKLLANAKANCFKTIIAYKHDRIARNLNDWVNLKLQLKKLGIKIIFSDDTEYTSDNSLQGDFIENLIMMVAELEPNNINERASNGRKQRRLEGVYNSANKVPFGYNRINSKSPSNGKSYYNIEPLEAIFIQHLFCEAKEVLGKEVLKIKCIKQKLLNSISNLLNSTSIETLSDMIVRYAHDGKIKLVQECEEESFLQKIIEALNKFLKETALDDIKSKLKNIRDHLKSTGNLQTILANSIYGGYMLLDSNEKQQGIIINGNIPKLNEKSFINISNVAPIINKNTFAKVYSYTIMPKVIEEVEPNFLFKGKLKCKKCNHLLHYKDSLLQCNCKVYSKNNVIESVLEIILDDAFNNSEEGFNNFCKTIEDKLKYLREDLQKLRNTKISILKEFLISKDKKYTQYVKINQDNQDNINFILGKIANYEHELSNINKLQGVIKHYNNLTPEIKKSNLVISKIKSLIISYIQSNEDIFNSIFNKLIKEIKVSTIEQKNDIKCRFTVNYEFKYDKPRRIPTCIN